MATTVTTLAGRQAPLTVVPPALAVQRVLIGDTLTLSVGDEGGRGTPWMALFVPIRLQGDRFAIDADGSPDGPVLASLRFRKTDRQQPRSPFSFRFARNDDSGGWLQGPAGTLVLLLYAQAESLAAELTDPQADNPAKESPIWKDVRDRIVRLLQRRSPDVLDLCKIVLTPAERAEIDPPSRAYSATPGGGSRAPAPTPVTFALASCQYPGDFLDRSPEFATEGAEGPADRSLLRLCLRRQADTPDRPEFLILCGDQVYVDATAGLFDPRVADDRYRLAYENYRGSLGVRKMLPRMPLVVGLFDDHEIADNWAPGDPEPRPDDVAAAFDFYWEYQRTASLPPREPRNRRVLWTTFDRLGLRFFVADTRSEREPRRAVGFENARLMDDAQFDALEAFVAETKADGLAFVVSPSILLPRHLSTSTDPVSALQSDSWEGYPASFVRLLAFLCDHECRHVVFLSGDEHVSCHARATIRCGGKTATLHSIHSSALYAPYPFANATADDFAGSERFDFQTSADGPRYTCEVESAFLPGDGFALVTVSPPERGRRRIDVVFDRGAAPEQHHLVPFTVPDWQEGSAEPRMAPHPSPLPRVRGRGSRKAPSPAGGRGLG